MVAVLSITVAASWVGVSEVATLLTMCLGKTFLVLLASKKQTQQESTSRDKYGPSTNYSGMVIRGCCSWKIALPVTILFLVTSYILVFELLARSQGYRPPTIPNHLVKNRDQKSNNNTDLLTVFLIDGLRADVFEEELEAGNLPAMQALAESGCWVRSVMATFPSITGYAYWPLLTGIDATRSGHLGTRYFDRRVPKGNWKNYYGPGGAQFEPAFDTRVPTLFEASAAQDQWTLAGNSMLKRGATVTYVASLEQYFSKLLHKWWLPKLLRKIPIVKWLAPDFYEFEKRFLRRMLRMIEQGQPRIVWTVFPSTDNVA